MKIRTLAALIALGCSGSAMAQSAPPPPPPPAVPGMTATGLPPLPPGCDGRIAPTRPAPPPLAEAAGFASALGISRTQADKVREVLEQRAAQAQKFEQQRQAADSASCRQLLDIVGTRGITRWAAAMPPPPPPPGPRGGADAPLPPPPRH